MVGLALEHRGRRLVAVQHEADSDENLAARTAAASAGRGGVVVSYAHFERLSAMDMSFLAMEDGRAHMHIGSVSIYDAEPLRSDNGAIDFERVLSFTEAQLHKFPRLRQRLEWVPGFAQPGWVDDERFNLRFHVRHTALPPPGDVRQLKRLAGRVLSQEFDRAKPLWEYWFVDRVAGDQLAVIAKMHHCMADGISGVAIGNLLVGPDPEYQPAPRREWPPGRYRVALNSLSMNCGTGSARPSGSCAPSDARQARARHERPLELRSVDCSAMPSTVPRRRH